MEIEIGSYVDPYVEPRVHTENLQKIRQALESQQLNLQKLVEMLGEHLVSTDEVVRARATGLLSHFLDQPAGYETLDGAKLELFASFYCARLQDYPCTEQVADGMLALAVRQILPLGALERMLRAVFQEVNVQMFPMRTRHSFLSLLHCSLTKYPKVPHRMGTDFVFGFLQAVDQEKDPRNLIVSFDMIPMVCGGRRELGHDKKSSSESDCYPEIPGWQRFCQEIFEVTACYFPITYRPPKDDLTITKAMLQQSLRNCFCASSKFAEWCIPMMIDKLSSESATDVQLDCLETLAVLFDAYDSEAATQFFEALVWPQLCSCGTVVSKNPTADGDMRDGVVEAAGGVVRSALAAISSGSDAANSAFQSVIDRMVADTVLVDMPWAAVYLQAGAEASLEACRLLLSTAMSSAVLDRHPDPHGSKNNIVDRIRVGRALVEGAVRFVAARTRATESSSSSSSSFVHPLAEYVDSLIELACSVLGDAGAARVENDENGQDSCVHDVLCILRCLGSASDPVSNAALLSDNQVDRVVDTLAPLLVQIGLVIDEAQRNHVLGVALSSADALAALSHGTDRAQVRVNQVCLSPTLHRLTAGPSPSQPSSSVSNDNISNPSDRCLSHEDAVIRVLVRLCAAPALRQAAVAFVCQSLTAETIDESWTMHCKTLLRLLVLVAYAFAENNEASSMVPSSPAAGMTDDLVQLASTLVGSQEARERANADYVAQFAELVVIGNAKLSKCSGRAPGANAGSNTEKVRRASRRVLAVLVDHQFFRQLNSFAGSNEDLNELANCLDQSMEPSSPGPAPLLGPMDPVSSGSGHCDSLMRLCLAVWPTAEVRVAPGSLRPFVTCLCDWVVSSVTPGMSRDSVASSVANGRAAGGLLGLMLNQAVVWPKSDDDYAEAVHEIAQDLEHRLSSSVDAVTGLGGGHARSGVSEKQSLSTIHLVGLAARGLAWANHKRAVGLYKSLCRSAIRLASCFADASGLVVEKTPDTDSYSGKRALSELCLSIFSDLLKQPDDRERVIVERHGWPQLHVVPFFEQKQFLTCLSLIAELSQTNAAPSLSALAQLMPYVPAESLPPHISSVLPLVLASLTNARPTDESILNSADQAKLLANQTNTALSALTTLAALMQSAPDEIQTRLVSVARTVIGALKWPAAHPRSVLVRAGAAVLLEQIAETYPFQVLFPIRRDVLDALGDALDDPKRMVRRHVIRARNIWFTKK